MQRQVAYDARAFEDRYVFLRDQMRTVDRQNLDVDGGKSRNERIYLLHESGLLVAAFIRAAEDAEVGNVALNKVADRPKPPRVVMKSAGDVGGRSNTWGSRRVKGRGGELSESVGG